MPDSTNPSPEAISPLHPRPRLFSPVQAFSALSHAYDAVCRAVKEDFSPLSPFQDTPQISRGNSWHRLRIDA